MMTTPDHEAINAAIDAEEQKLLAEQIQTDQQQAQFDLNAVIAKNAAEFKALQDADAAAYADLLAKYNADEALLHPIVVPPVPTTSFGVNVLSGGHDINQIKARYGVMPKAARLFWSGLPNSAIPAHPGTRLILSFKQLPAVADLKSWLTGATKDDIVCLNHEMDNDNWTDAQVAAWKANVNVLISVCKELGLSAPAIIYTGGAFFQGISSAVPQRYWVPGCVLGVDLDGNQANPNNLAKTGWLYTNYGPTLTSIAKFMAANKITRFIVPELQCKYDAVPSKLDPDGSIHAAWLVKSAQMAATPEPGRPAAEIVTAFEFGDLPTRTFVKADLAALSKVFLANSTAAK